MEYLTKQEVADLLKISTHHADCLMRQDGFPVMKIGRSRRVTRDALDKYLAENNGLKLDWSVFTPGKRQGARNG